MTEEFCVVCGRTDRALEEGVCSECYAERNPLLEVVDSPSITVCPSCGARPFRDRWERSETGKLIGASDLNPLLRPHPDAGLRRVHWTEVAADSVSRTYDGEATIRFRGQERTVPVHLKVRVISKSCPECSRKAGHFYTAQIQLRGPVSRLPPRAHELRARLLSAWEAVLPEARPEWRAALSWAEKPEGWDFFMTDTLSARSLGRLLKARLHASLKESATLWGRKDGHDVYRVTICIRVPSVGRPKATPEEEAESPRPEDPVERHA